MSYELYLCAGCPDLIWFPYGDVQHVGTGWDCPYGREDSQEHGDHLPIGRAKRGAPRARLDASFEHAVALYHVWRRSHRDRGIFVFLARQLDRRREDVVRRFLAYLIREEVVDQRRALIGRLVLMPAWDRFVDRMSRANAAKRKRPALARHAHGRRAAIAA